MLVLFAQIGGNDQLGNISTGYELISKVSDQLVYGKISLFSFLFSFLG